MNKKIIVIRSCAECLNMISSYDALGIANCAKLLSKDIHEKSGISNIDGTVIILPDCPLEDYPKEAK